MKKNILAIIGSASKDSSNLKLVNHIAEKTGGELNISIFDRLKDLPHFDPELSIGDCPGIILDLRETISRSDGIINCTPEYVFSIPSGLKNAIEWCVATTVFSKKPVGLITASAHGQKGHEELKLIMKTIEARFTEETCLLIQGVKGKWDETGNITEAKTEYDLSHFIKAYLRLVNDVGETLD